MQEYLLSIIIPTKNRQYYCLNSVKQILACYGDEIEIVIQDNSDEPILEKEIRELDRNNIIYHYQGGILSFVDNFDMAIQLATGKYLMLIGDDDGITSLALKAAKWADENGVSSIKPALSFVYFWPNSKVFEKDDNGILNISSYDGKIEEYDPQNGLRKLLNQSCQNYLDSDLIKIYHGMVRRDLVDEIKNRIGKHVGGLSPDIYLSVALSIVSVGCTISLNVPLTISGICTGSGSSQSATGEHTGKLEDAPHFRGHDNYEWDNRIPRFYSVETIWGDSALAAVKDLNPELTMYYKPETLTYRCLRKYPNYKKEVLDSYYKNGGRRIKLGLYVCSRVVNKIGSTIRVTSSTKAVKKSTNLNTIEQASTVCEGWIEEHQASFEFEKKQYR